ncbi:MAG: hypothetical protein V3W34_03715 [Phycisphaerae bacterium]
MKRSVSCVLVLGVLCMPVFGQTPTVFLEAQAGATVDLTNPLNPSVLAGNQIVVEVLLDGTAVTVPQVAAIDIELRINDTGAPNPGTLECADFIVDTARADLAVESCSLCAATCGPPPPIAAGVLDVVSPWQDVNFVAYIATITLDASVGADGDWVLGYGTDQANVLVASTTNIIIDIVNNPGSFQTLTITVRPLIGACCLRPVPACQDGVTLDECENTLGGEFQGDLTTCPPNPADLCKCTVDPDCDDGLICNGQEFCLLGTCLSGQDATAGTPCGDPTDTECNPADTCNGSGVCLDNIQPNGTPCDDGVLCTVGETCLAAVCQGGGTNDCDDGLPCTTDSCNLVLDVCDNDLNVGFCLIDNVCHSNGDPNPANECELCNTLVSTVSWSPATDGLACTDDGNDCTDDVCAAGACTHPNLPGGTPCDDGLVCTGTGQPGVGIDTCDGAGNCSGALDLGTFVCRPDAGECDVEDTCDGVSPTCPPDAFEPETTPCGDPDATDCNAPDTCDTSGSCIDRVKPGVFVCRPSVAECDAEDTCDGVSAICPADDPEPEFTACGDPSDTECTDPDTCDDAGVCQPRHAAQFTGCGDPSDTDCTDPDTCDGAGACQPRHAAKLTACGDPSDTVCTDPDTCDVTGVCRPRHAAELTACGDPNDTECTDPDTCDDAGACQPRHAAEFTPCGDPDSTDCNAADSCDASGSCIDRFKPGGFVCRPDAGDCDVEETCGGLSAICPPQAFEPDGTACTDEGNDCTNDICAAGQCTHPNLPDDTACADEGNDCTNDICAAGQCTHPNLPDDTACNDAQACTVNDKCVSGTCVGAQLPAPVVEGGISSRFIRVRLNGLPEAPVALHVTNLCSGVDGWVQLEDSAVDDGPNGTISVAVATAGNVCTDADFFTPSQWSGDMTVYIKGTTITPEAQYTVVVVCDDCQSPFVSEPAGTVNCTWHYSDTSGDGQVTFFADLFKMFQNTEAQGFPFYLGPDPGYEVDTQGQNPNVPDGQVTFFADIFSAFQATQAAVSEDWNGPICPQSCP